MASQNLTVADISMSAELSYLDMVDWKFDRWPKLTSWRETVSKEPGFAEINGAVEEFKKSRAAKSG